ncbi:hypothetical protein [Pseudonocardia endophytica]|uniref:Uncharacterized protein n=1 Tax=Pseudonocardia endophytica TaxID=401976 RepID=A0A4R1HXR6_PSEEN|nr:hypothetical protein [Pseudonocardia endophytica]TCK27168.1 hypothetical protein EV378_3027 [Pseudonocardia endophytica]
MIFLIGIVVVGLAVLGIAAVVIGVVDSAQSAAWRRIAAERRATWERRQQLLGHRRNVDAWADEDTD